MAKSAEDSIREYLSALELAHKPQVDKEAVKALKAEIKGTSDPINKLKLNAALLEAESGVPADLSGLEAVFVAEAAKYAEANALPVEAFQALGVADDVLTKAGFTIATKSAPKAKSASAGARAPRLSLEEVVAAIRDLPEQWKVAELAEGIEREKPTTNNYVKSLLEAGTIAVVGEDSSGRGKPAKLYQLS